jgi:PhoH-like ATPase
LLFNDISQEAPMGKTVRVYSVPSGYINDLFRDNHVPVDNLPVYPNQPLILKCGQQSAMALVSKDGKTLHAVEENLSFFSIHGRNKEQVLLQNILQDPDIRLVVVTGRAGTGKTVVLGSYVLQEIMQARKYKRLLLSKPLEIVTKTRFWGTMPGDERDKFGPFLKSYQIMFEGIVGAREGNAYVETAIKRGTIMFFPLELMRGASLKDCICWFDEAQNLNHHEMNTLGSRIDDVGGSKLILSGDLHQQDREGMDESSTGLSHLIRSERFLRSPYTAHIHLVKNERGVISQLFHDIFDRNL